MEIQITHMMMEHLPEILKIEEESFSDPWSRKMFEDELKDDGRRISVAMTADGKVIGYAVGWVVLDEFHLGNIAVEQSLRKKGLGENLLKEVLRLAGQNGCRMASLEVRASNEVAIGLYQKNDFKAIAIRKKYYQDEDALVMIAEIKSGDKC